MLDLADVQGLVIRGYTLPSARHLLLRVDVPASGRELLGSLVDGDPRRPQVTTGTPWEAKPDCRVNLSVTAGGLRALGVPEHSMASFPKDFLTGAAARADRVEDVGPSAPQHWLPVFTDPGFRSSSRCSGSRRGPCSAPPTTSSREPPPG